MISRWDAMLRCRLELVSSSAASLFDKNVIMYEILGDPHIRIWRRRQRTASSGIFQTLRHPSLGTKCLEPREKTNIDMWRRMTSRVRLIVCEIVTVVGARSYHYNCYRLENCLENHPSLLQYKNSRPFD